MAKATKAAAGCTGGTTHLLNCGHLFTSARQLACARNCYYPPPNSDPSHSFPCTIGTCGSPSPVGPGEPPSRHDPCVNSFSNRHILDCMHVVDTDADERCGANCRWTSNPQLHPDAPAAPPPSLSLRMPLPTLRWLTSSPAPFICPKCTEARLWEEVPNVPRMKQILKERNFELQTRALPVPEQFAVLRVRLVEEKMQQVAWVYGSRMCREVETEVEDGVLKREAEAWNTVVMELLEGNQMYAPEA